MITASETRAPVLIVDDDASKRLAIKAVLAPHGYEIVEADGAIEALRRVRARDFAVILLDVRMPITDGFETAALIRCRRQSETTPIIFITGQATDEVARTNRYAQGAVDFMFAPVHPEELRAKVRALAGLFVRSEELAAQARAVQESADQLRLLNASASHELRTPIASIIGFVEEILENDAMSDEDRGFLDVVYRNAQRLNQLVDDLLILDQAEVGGSRMVLEPTSLPPLVARVMSIFTTSALRAEIVLTSNHETDPPMAMIDPLRFEQALTNLVSNALKFTPRGGVVSVGVRSAGESVEVSVADTGAGIDPADLGNVFDPFYRTQSAVDTAVKGSGLGLAIARTMIEAQNGELRVLSRRGEGSIFTMRVPIATRHLQVVE